MSSEKFPGTSLTRRRWLILSASTLSACGGGGGGGGGGISVGLPGTGGTGNYATLPGTGGTGIYVRGSISGFGSVWVNGIKFDDTAAAVQLEGQTGASADLRLGMVASIQGQRSTDLLLGVASSIDIWSIAQGRIASPLPGQFTVAGMTVQTDSGTAFDGLIDATALTPGLNVKVWGLQASTDAGRWIATRVAVVNGTSVASTGLVTVSGAVRSVNGLELTGPLAAPLIAGRLVRVEGTLSSAGNILQVNSVKLLGADSEPVPQGEAEIEGLVTTVLSPTRFTLGTVEVDAANASFSPTGAAITVGARLEVGGTWQAGVLKATKVKLEDAGDDRTIEIEARIEAYTDLAHFVVRGQRCDATQSSISHGTAADLKVGVKVQLKGTLNGDVLMVSKLELELED